MNNELIVKKVLTTILPFLKSRSVKTIGNDISNAINNEVLIMWNNIKHVFIKEEFVAQLEDDPKNNIAKGGLEYKLSSKLNEDGNFKQSILNSLENIQKLSTQNLGDNISHTGSGDIIKANVVHIDKRNNDANKL